MSIRMRFFQRFTVVHILSLTACLLMGAGSPLKSNVTGSVTSDIAGGITNGLSNGLSSGVTGSIASGTTTSLVRGVNKNASAGVISRVSVTLSPNAEELAKIIKFDRRILIIVKEETQDRIGRLVGFDSEGYQINAPGIVVSVPEDKTDHVLASLRRKLHPLNYMPFVVEMNDGLKIDRIGILKGYDQYEILRIMNTAGDDYDISNQDIIDRLKDWEKISSFDIIGADSEWVEVEFKAMPKDLNAFVEEVYDFCPDSVDQGQGSIAELAKEILKTKRLFLWWD
jgi:hypothetical protein